MSSSTPKPSASSAEELRDLISQLHTIKRRIAELAGGQLDAIADETGQPWLLPDAQSQLRAAEAQQRRFATLRRNIIDTLPAQIAVLDRDGRIVAVNQAWRRFARNESDQAEPIEWEGVDYLAACTDDRPGEQATIEGISQAIRRALSGESVAFSAEYPCHTPTHKRWFRCHVNTLAPPESGALVMHTEITDVHREAEARREAEAQLRQAQRLESIGQLTGGIAHDFNNLLTVILGNAEMLGDVLPADSQHWAMADMITSAAQRGADLTQRLLAFARRQPLEPQAVDVNALVFGMEDLLRRTLGGHIEIRVRPEGGLPPALVDPAQLESALLNLALNARDAMAEGGLLVLETSFYRINEGSPTPVPLPPGDYVDIAVTDTGSGIAESELERVFEPFYTTKGSGKGSGLGLSMVYGFAKQSEGHVGIESTPGRGTTVHLCLPRAPSQHPRPSSSGATPGETVEAPREEARILLVEDDELVRRYAQSQLLSLGYQVAVAESGEAALAILEDDRDFDLLFTDIEMPGGMSGAELAGRVRELQPGIEVLFTSGYAEHAIVHDGRLDPGVHLLSKPYRRAELGRRIAQVLGHRDGG